MSKFPSIDRSRELILEAAGPSTEPVLVSCGSMASDALAAAGARELLRDRPYREIGLDDLSSASGKTALLVGGTFSRAERDVMPRALAVAELRFERVIVLPCSFDLSDEKVIAALSRTRATVFASEPDSHAAIASLCDADQAHDCSFFVDFTPYEQTGSGVLEAFGEGTSGATLDLDGWLQSLASHEVVRTDRARVMVAAALMGKRVEYAPGVDPGIESIARHALGNYSVTRIESESVDNAPAPAALDAEAEETLARLQAAALAVPPPAPATSTVRVTAVVLTRDRPSLLLRALASLERSRTRVRTLVVDNNSAPAAAQGLARACEGRKDTELKRSERNLGCAGGRLLATELVDTDFVLFLDDDAELMPGAIEHLISELDAHPDAGAVTATVVRPDGTVLHSGGSMEMSDELVTFELLEDGLRFDEELMASGPSGWAPGTALLARTALLAEFPFDQTMGAYFEDNEWAYRISRARPRVFRRSREALVVHHIQPKHAPKSDFASRSRIVELLASYARFYELHGRLLGPWLFDHIPELRADNGSCDLGAARLLMELVSAKGTDWIFMEWMRGDLDALLSNRQRRAAEAEVGRLTAQVRRLKASAARDNRTIAVLDERLRRVEQSVTLQFLRRVRAWTFALLGGERSRAVGLLQATLRLVGRAVPGSRSQSVAGRPSSRLIRASRGGTGPILFPEVGHAEVSIVIPVYAHAELTDAALHSILDHTEPGTYELILVDDSDDAATKALLERVRGARIITNESNLGYLRSIKRGADAAQGRWLVLCNNDIEVQPGWLEALLDCGESHPSIAIVAPKYFYPDGTLAEAGGIIWRDGTGANYGRRDDPDSCQYEYRREIDYGSAAALMVRTDFWRSVGGFDQRFEPMYYEDTDLCFEARRRGFRVMYEPSAEVIHLEGATAGVDESSGHKRHQAENRPKFVSKWRDVLAAEHLEPTADNLWLAANRHRGSRLLVIDHRVPTWDRDSGGLRMRGVLEALIGLGCHVSLLPDNGSPMQPYTRELQRLGVEVLYGVDPEIELARIAPALSLAILSRVKIADRWLERVRRYSSARTVFDTVDLHWLREARKVALARGPGGNGAPLPPEVMAMRELELSLIRRTDATLVVTEEERAQVVADVPDALVHVVPNVHELRQPVPTLERRRGVLFVGGFEHPPNVDAALKLVGEVMPPVWRELPDVPVTIVGADAPPEVEALASERVDVRGWVADLEPLLDSARLLAAPLTYGAGLKGKVTQALAFGLPVVTTPVGAEGLDATDGEQMLIGETPEALAERIMSVLRDDELWHRLVLAGQRLVAERCSPEMMSSRLAGLLEELTEGPVPARLVGVS